MSIICSQFCIEKSRWERESCPLSGIEKRPPLGGYVSIKVMLDTGRPLLNLGGSVIGGSTVYSI